MMRTLSATLALAAWAATATAQIVDDGPILSNEGEEMAEAIECGGVDAILFVNAPEYAKPTLEVNGGAITFEDGPNYAGPVCVEWRGEPHVGVTEYMGNAYEVYRLVDVGTREVSEITYREAEKLGWYD